MYRHIRLLARLCKKDPAMMECVIIQQTHRTHEFTDSGTTFIVPEVDVCIASLAVPYIYLGVREPEYGASTVFCVRGEFDSSDSCAVRVPVEVWPSIVAAVEIYNNTHKE